MQNQLSKAERNDMVAKNINLVHFVARKLNISSNAYFSYEDIVQEGTIGLVKAVDNFNPDLGFAFSTYAAKFIQGYIMRFIRENQHKLKYSRSILDIYAKLNRSDKPISEVSPQELEELGINREQMLAINSMVTSFSIDDTTYNDKDGKDLSFSEMIVSPSSDIVSEEFYELQLDEIKDEVLAKFTKTYSKDLLNEWYYSKIIGTPTTQNYLSNKYNISQAQVAKNIQKFKKEMLNLLQEYGYEVADYLKE